MKRLLVGIVLALAMMGLLPQSGLAATFATGDVFASVGGGLVRVYTSAGVLKDTLVAGSGFTTGSATDAAGNFYVTNFTENRVYRFVNGGSNTGTIWINSTDMPGATQAESILFDAAGNAYVGHAGGNYDLTRHSAAGGMQTASYNLAVTARGSDWIDLAADQTTLYYTSENYEIKRFDLNTNTQLTDFTSGSGTGRPKYALRLLSDGSVLVADQNFGVRRFNAAGTLVQTYTVPGGTSGWFALNLDPDGTSFWTGRFSNATLYKFDIATGTMLQTIATGAAQNQLFGVSVYGELTQSGGGVQAVPEPGALVLFGTMLLGLAIKKRTIG